MAGAGKMIVWGDELIAAQNEVAARIAMVGGATMGPSGQTVGIGRDHGGAKATKDGVTAIGALEWSTKKPAWRALAAFIKEDNSSVNNACGDCTTTNAVLACSLLKKVNSGKAGGMPVVELHAGIDAARKLVLEHLNTSSRPITKKQDTINIAEISSNGDKMVSQAIADIFEKVGKDGVITVDAGNTTNPVETDIVQGLSFSNGYISTYFVTDTNSMTAELDNPYIFLINEKLSSIQQILPILEAIVQSGRSLLIIAEDVDSEALATLIFNKMRGGLKVCATKAPGFGDRRKEMLEDIAILTGGQLFVKELGMKIESTQLSMLGSAKKVTVYKDKTVIVGGSGDKTELDNRIAAIKKAKEQSTSDYDKEKLQERIGKLSGGVAVIRVGGTTEAEVKERKDRYEDALNATRAALDGGIVIGGGVALYNAKKALSKLKMNTDVEQAGVNMVSEALSACLERILTNAGYNWAVIANKLEEMNDPNQVFNARTGQFVNAFEAGVVDPAKGVKIAFDTAVSTVLMLTGMAVLIVDEPEDSSSGNVGGKGGGAGGYGGPDMDF